MKFNLFVICVSCVVARYSFYTVPKDKPVMYFDGAEWRSMKPPNRNITSGTRRPNLSALLDIFFTPSSITKANNCSGLEPSTPQVVIARVFDEDFQQETRHKIIPPNKTAEIIFRSNATKEITTTEFTTTEITTTDKSDYSIILTHMLNDTAKLQNNSKPQSLNASLRTDPAEWIKLMLELSLTLKEIAEKQNVSYYTHIQKTRVTNTMKATSARNITTTISTTSKPNSTEITNTTKKPKINLFKRRRAMDGIEDLVAILTGGIEIDNGSESSDEINKGNNNYLRKVFSPKGQVKEMRQATLNKDNYDLDQNRDTDSGDIVSDGVEETRFVLVEDKSDADDVRLKKP